MSHDTMPGTQQPVPPEPPPPGGYPPQYPYPPYWQPTTPRSGVPWYVWLIGGVVGIALVGTVLCAGLAAALGSLIRTVANETEQTATIPHQFTVTGAPAVAVHNITGTISIRTGGDGTVQVQIIKRARDVNAQQAQADLNDIHVTFAQTNNTVSIDVQPSSGSNLRRQLAADVQVTVPVASTLDVRAVTGTVRVSGVTMQGSAHVSLTTGSIVLDGALANGASLDVRLVTGNATLTLPTQTAAHLDATTVTGNVQINGWSIPVTGTVTSHHASGDLGQHPTGTVTVRVTTGNITVSAR